MTTVLVAENVPVLILTPTANPEYFSVSYDDFSVHLEIRHRCDPFFLNFVTFLIYSFFTTSPSSGWDSVWYHYLIMPAASVFSPKKRESCSRPIGYGKQHTRQSKFKSQPWIPLEIIGKYIRPLWH